MNVRGFSPLILICGILIFLPLAAEGQFDFDQNPLVGKQAPDFTLKTLTGKSMSLHEYRKGQPAIIFFWATWCPHCRDEIKVLSTQAQAMQDRGIKIVLVNLEEGPDEVRAFIDKYNFKVDVFLDEGSRTADEYSIVGVPTLFFIDKDGVIVLMDHGLPRNFAEMLSVPIRGKTKA